MQVFRSAIVDFLVREDGPSAVEYAVMLAIIIIVCVASITAMGTNSNKSFTKAGSGLSTSS